MGYVTLTSTGHVYFALSHELFPPHLSYRVPNPDEIGLGETESALSNLESAGLRLTSHLDAFPDRREFDALFKHASFDRQREIAKLLRGAGQSVNLVVAAVCESHGLLRSVSGAAESSMRSPGEQMWDLQRAGFVLEGCAQYLVSIGHYLANVGVRCGLESGAVRERVPTMAKAPAKWLTAASTPGSRDQKAWIFHSNSRLVVEAIGGRSKAIQPLRVAARLNDAASWKPMVDLRGTFFHRVREEFPAAPDGSAAAVERLLGVNVAAVRCLGRAVPAFVLALQAASPRVAHGCWGRNTPQAARNCN
jgi:hypothetical protein